MLRRWVSTVRTLNASLGHHLQAGHGFQSRAQAVAYQGMIVDEHDAGRLGQGEGVRHEVAARGRNGQ